MHIYSENHAIFDYRVLIVPNLRSKDEGRNYKDNNP